MVLTCGSCTYEPEEDLGKYLAVYVKGQMRIMMEPLGANLLVCPKCGVTASRPGFRRSERSAKQERNRKSDLRVAQLKQLYGH